MEGVYSSILFCYVTSKVISLLTRGKLHKDCVQSCMLHGCETWPVKQDNELTHQWAEMIMIRQTCGVNVTAKFTCKVERQVRNR